MPDDPQIGSRRGNTLHDVVGACLRGWREGDDQTRKNVRGWLALFSGGGLAVYIAVQAWGLGEEGIRRSWMEGDKRDAVLAEKIDKLADSIDRLVVKIADTQARQDRVNARLLDRLPTVKPGPKAQSNQNAPQSPFQDF